jgi:hypothetical protein
MEKLNKKYKHIWNNHKQTELCLLLKYYMADLLEI